MNKITRIMAVAAFLAVTLPGGAWAGSSDDTRTVTVTVPATLSITDEVGNFTLPFQNGSTSGAVSKNQNVGYRVICNSMPNSALSGAISAKISAALTGVTIRGQSESDAFDNQGTGSNATLVSVNVGNPISVGTSTTAIATKPSTSAGTAGTLLNGTYFINWTALATQDLGPGTVGTTSLTVTLKDA